MNEQTLIITPKFSKRSANIQSLRKFADTTLERSGEDISGKIEFYLSLMDEPLQRKVWKAGKLATLRLFRLYNIHMSCHLAGEIEGKAWRVDERSRCLSFLTLRNQVEYYFDITAEKPMRFSSIKHDSMACHLGQLCLLNDQARFKRFTALYLNKCEQNYDMGYDNCQSQLFMLCLATDYCGYVPTKLPEHAYSNELYHRILEHWQDAESETLQELLVQACNRHTHQASYDNEDGFRDWSMFYAHLPVEILMLQRLRQWRGLPEVSVDHILMAAPFDKLPPAADTSITDPLVERFITKFRTDFVDFDDVIASGMQRPLASKSDADGINNRADIITSQHNEEAETRSSTESPKPELKHFINPFSGIGLTAPSHWVDHSSQESFQVIEDKTGTQITATVYDNRNDYELKEWAKLRFQAVDERMPYLTFDKSYFSIPGPNWTGYASSYTGTFPDDDKVSKYVVIAFIKYNKLVSLSITAAKEVYEKNKHIYQKLVTENFDLYEVKNVHLEG